MTQSPSAAVRGVGGEEEEEDLFVFNDTVEGPRGACGECQKKKRSGIKGKETWHRRSKRDLLTLRYLFVAIVSKEIC